MAMGILNAYYVTSELKIKDYTEDIGQAFLCSATESEFEMLLNNYLSDNSYNSGLFASYVASNGHYCMVFEKELFSPGR